MPERLKLSAFDSEDERRRWKIIRLDMVNGGEVPGLIIAATKETGLCLMQTSADEASQQEYNFGPNGLRIVRVG
jgi:hypothetical protein